LSNSETDGVVKSTYFQAIAGQARNDRQKKNKNTPSPVGRVGVG